MELEITKEFKGVKGLIATYGNGKGYIKLDTNSNNSLISRLKSMEPKELKKMINSDMISKSDIKKLLKSSDKCHKYLDSEKQNFKIYENSVMFTPNFDLERECIYIFGSSGSGKSTLCKNYGLLYKKYYKKNDIFLISMVDNDDSLKELNYTHIPLKEEVISDIDLSSLNNSLIIFDDTDIPDDKKLEKMIDTLKDNIAQRGRHEKISAIFTTHLAANFNRTKVLLSECHKFVIFPGAGGVVQQKRMFITYGGMSTTTFESLKNLKSRWVLFHVRYPNYIVYDSGVKILSD